MLPTNDEFALPEVPVEDEFAISEEENRQIDEAFARRQARLTAIRYSDPAKTYNQIMSEYFGSGMSEILEDDRRFLEDYTQQMQSEATREAILDAPDPDSAMMAAEDIASSNAPVISTEEAALIAASETEPSITPAEAQTKFLSAEHLYEIATGPGTKELQNILNMMNPATETGSLAQQARDFTAAAVAPGFQVRFAGAINSWKPGLLSESDMVLPGTASRKVKEYLLSIKEDPELFREEVRGLAEAITQAGRPFEGTGAPGLENYENDFEIYDYWNLAVGDLFAEDDIFQDIDVMVNNVFGLLDAWTVLLPAAGPVVRTFRGIYRAAVNTPIETVARVAPRTAREVHKAAQKGTPADREALGEDMPTLNYEHGMVKPMDEEIRATYELASDFNINDNIVLAQDPKSLMFSPVERDMAMRRQVNRINTLFGGLDDTMHMSKTRVESISGGFRVKWTLGHTSTSGFANLQQAKDVAGRYREVLNGARVEYYKRDYESGTFKPVSADEPLDEAGEYAIGIEEDYFYGSQDIDPDTLDDNFFMGVTGSFAKNLDASSQYPEWFVNASNIAADYNSAVTAELTKIMRPMTRLSDKKRARVLKLLEKQERLAPSTPEGFTEGRWLSPREVWREFGGDKELADAFFAHRKHTRAMRQLLNRKFYRQLRSEGMETVVFNNLKHVDGRQLGKPIQVPAGQSFRVFDPDTETFVTRTRDELQEALDSGDTLVEMRRPVRVGQQEGSYVLVKSQSRFARVEDLPTEVIREIPGYIPRQYPANFQVARVYKTRRFKDGKEVEKEVRVPLAFARTMDEAQAELRAQQDFFRGTNEAQGTAEELRILTTREMDDAEQAYMRRQSVEYYEDSGQLFTSSRGDQLRPLREGGYDGRYGLNDILEAMDNAQSVVARGVADREWVDIATERWEQVYGSRFGIAEYEGGPRKRMPLFGEVERSRDAKANIEDYRKAVALRDHILRVAGVDNSRMSQWYRRRLLEVSDWFYNRNLNWAGDAAVARSQAPAPTEAAKRLSFVYNIVWNPLRQLVLQSTQASLYANAPYAAKYLASPQGLGDYFGVTVRLMTPRTDEFSSDILKWADDSVKKLGGDPAKTNRIYEGLLKTGLIQATDSHQYHIAWSPDPIRSGASNRNFLDNPRNFVTRSTRLLRRAGFDIGENSHMITAFLVERNRWIRENPKIADKWDEADNLFTISGRARQRSGNMSSAGALGFQRGGLSLMTQFMSHTLKMGQIMIPEKALGKTIGKLSNKFYTGKERFRIALTQSALFGTAGFGGAEAIETYAEYMAEQKGEVIDIPDDVRLAIREGVVGTSINLMARAAAGEDIFKWEDVEGDEPRTDSQFAANFGPMSGLAGLAPRTGEFTTNPFVKVAEAILLQQDSSILEAWAGASWGGAESFAKHTANALSAVGVMPGLTAELRAKPEEMIPYVLREMGRIVPAYDKWFRTRAVDTAGRLITASNELGVPATEGEALLMKLLGLKTTADKRINDYIMDQQGYRVEVEEGESHQTKLRDVAKTLYERVLSYARQKYDGEIDELEFQRLANFEHLVVQMQFSEDDIENIRGYFRERVFSDLNESQDAVLAELVSRQRSTGDLRAVVDGEPTYRDATFLSNFPDFPGKKYVIEGMKYWHGVYE